MTGVSNRAVKLVSFDSPFKLFALLFVVQQHSWRYEQNFHKQKHVFSVTDGIVDDNLANKYFMLFMKSFFFGTTNCQQSNNFLFIPTYIIRINDLVVSLFSKVVNC